MKVGVQCAVTLCWINDARSKWIRFIGMKSDKAGSWEFIVYFSPTMSLIDTRVSYASFNRRHFATPEILGGYYHFSCGGSNASVRVCVWRSASCLIANHVARWAKTNSRVIYLSFVVVSFMKLAKLK